MPDQPATPPLFRAAPVALLRAPLRARSHRPDWAAVDGPKGSAPADRASCLALLRGAAADALFMDALRVASPSLARLVTATTEAATTTAGTATGRTDAQLRRAVISVLRYELRLRTRCTPFGLFAGVAPLRFEEPAGTTAPVKTAWTAPPSSRTRVDLDWLNRLIRQLEQQPELLPHLTLHRHAGTVRRGGRLVMSAPSNPGSGAGDTARSEVSVRRTPVVAAALEFAGSGPTGAAAVAELQRRFPQAGRGQIAGLLATLVRQEFLITGLRPVLDGSDPLGRLVEVLAAAERSIGHPLPILAALRAVAADRDRYDRTPLGGRAAALTTLADGMRQLADSERLLHVDLALGAEIRLPGTVAEEAARALDVLWRLAPVGHGLPHLRTYHREFLERYGADRVVPLAELLDDTVGLGAPAGYGWPASSRPEEPSRRSAPARDALLARLAATAVQAGGREVVLDDALVDRLAAADPGTGPAPRSCQLFTSLVAADQQALVNGDFLLVATGGPSHAEAGATFGRFAGLPGAAEPVDSVLGELTELAFPEVDGSIHLSVAYQPRTTRALNLANSRRSARHQIAIGLPPDPGAIAVQLEEIGVAATPDHLYAMHLPTGHRLLPHAHNAIDLRGQAPNAARLLLELGRDAYRMCAPWDWGASAHAPFLPRVRYGRVVLCPAVWRLDELREQTALGPSDWRAAVDRWRQQWRAPEQIVLTKFDLRLPLDLSAAWHLELLRDAITKDPDLSAVEQAGGEDRPGDWLRDQDGHAHPAELSMAFINMTGHQHELPSPPVPAPTATQARDRAADPGGDWLYARLYLAGRHTDGFLGEHLPAFLAELPASVGELIDRWFFVRYRDEADHLRLRFHGPADRLWPHLLPPLRDAVARWREQGLVGRFVLDGYEPEWERYGGPEAQPAAERFFTADSRAALALLAAARRHPARPLDVETELPWDSEVLAALSIASIAHAFGSPAASVRPSRHQEACAAWLSGVPADAAELPAGFRSRRAHWLRLIDPVDGHPGLVAHPAGPAVLAALADRADQLKAYRAELDRLTYCGANPSPLPRVLSALLHMSCNRLLGPDREAELRAMALARACVIGNADRRRHQR
ncbi:lantibiotic dehydratase [Streptomyces sp. NPDC050485]|uniref:lantibiotic dehydratase n=1 Tax=Streptomyces sp. NPDC050485 TaxID=3365617 RepID=UPI00378A5B42